MNKKRFILAALFSGRRVVCYIYVITAERPKISTFPANEERHR